MDSVIHGFISDLSNRLVEMRQRLLRLFQRDLKATQADDVYEGNDLVEFLKCLQFKEQEETNAIESMQNQVAESLKKVSDSQTMVDYGVKGNGLKLILARMIIGHCLPTPNKMKYAIVAETRYGSYPNAELLIALMLGLFECGLFSWENQEDCMHLSRALLLMIRHAPNPHLAVFYFEKSMEWSNDWEKYGKESICPALFACVVFNLVISIPKDVEEVTNEQEIDIVKQLIEHYYALNSKLVKQSDDIIKSIYRTYQNSEKSKSLSQLIAASKKMDKNEEESDVTSVVSFSSVATEKIEMKTTEHAELRMKERGISIMEVKRCVKHGIRQTDKYAVMKATDGNLIVVFMMRGIIPEIITTYRHTSKEKLLGAVKQEASDIMYYCDYLMTMAFYGDFAECDFVFERLLEIDPDSISAYHREVLQSVLALIFKDGVSSLLEARALIQIMEHFNIHYDK